LAVAFGVDELLHEVLNLGVEISNSVLPALGITAARYTMRARVDVVAGGFQPRCDALPHPGTEEGSPR
jgi:hypothetical protein